MIHAVMTSENRVAAHGVESRLTRDIRSTVVLIHTLPRARKRTASHANNRANVRWLYRGSADMREVSSDIRAVSTLDRQLLAATPYGIFSSTKSFLYQGFVDEHPRINPATG